MDGSGMPGGENIAGKTPVSAVPMRCYRGMFAQPIVSLTIAQFLRGAIQWLSESDGTSYSSNRQVSQDRILL